MTKKIVTIGGEIDAEKAGVVLPHEHIFLNLMPEFRGVGLLSDVEAAVHELSLFQEAGGGTLVELSVGSLGNGSVSRGDLGSSRNLLADPVTGSRPVANLGALQEVSIRANVSIVAGTGHYREPYLDKDWFDRTSVDEIAEFLIADIEEGFPGSDARAGVIGEIGADKWYISAAEERSFRAAARAHARTGLAVTTHAARWAAVGWAQLQLLAEEGVPPEKIIMGHVDTVADPEYPLAMAKQGVYVQFDTFFHCVVGGEVNRPALERRVKAVVDLVRAGHLDRILLSQDVCKSTHLTMNGGAGYAFLLTHAQGELLAAGLSEEEIRTILVENPAHALAV